MLKNYLLLVSSFVGACLGAQEVHSALQLRNSHLWRGIEVSAGLIYTGDLHLDYKNFYAGFWAGGNVDGSYKEFNNYIGYKNKHLTLELWDIYNFSPGATYNNKEFFNYSAKETGRFWDFRSYYTISDQFPLVLSWNTVVFGRDRNSENTGNKYSSFVSGEYPVYKKDNLEVRGRVGYAFALDSHGEKNNFFAKDSGFNEISLIVSKSFTIEGYKIPVGIWGMWNPVNNNAFLQFSVQVYSFGNREIQIVNFYKLNTFNYFYTMEYKKNKAVCFGEMLWDIFPGEQKRVGGAPFNVAYHLSKMGVEVDMISSIGNDQLGRDLLDKMKNWNIPANNVQINIEHPTSTVIATVDENNDAHYDIVEGVAWDFIETTPENQEVLKTTNAFVFGTLAARNEKSRNTLFQLLELNDYNVFDINLREPYYEVGMIKDLLHKTHLAKFNKAEMRMMLDFLGKEYTTEEDGIKYLQDKFDLEEIIISKGSKGALYASWDNFYLYPTIPVTVKDTVGSGDSFLAGFLSKRLEKGNTIHEIMTQAVSLGAFITSQEGACPEYSLEDFIRFRNQHPVSVLS